MTIYLEITKSEYTSSGFRNNSKSYVPIEVEDLSKDTLETVLKKYCSDNDIMFGMAYNPGMVGTNPHSIQYFSTSVIVPSKESEVYEYWVINYSPVDNWTRFDTTIFHNKVLVKTEDQNGISFDWYNKSDYVGNI